MKYRLGSVAVLLAGFLLIGCGTSTPLFSQTATITVMFDMYGGGAGKQLIIRAQEVTTGKTYTQIYSASSHGGVVLPTSPPQVFEVEAPGTYVFYANILNAPDDYHYGATGCAPAPDCDSTTLKALDVLPGKTYQIYFSNRSGERHAPLPTPHEPITVPWEK